MATYPVDLLCRIFEKVKDWPCVVFKLRRLCFKWNYLLTHEVSFSLDFLGRRTNLELLCQGVLTWKLASLSLSLPFEQIDTLTRLITAPHQLRQLYVACTSESDGCVLAEPLPSSLTELTLLRVSSEDCAPALWNNLTRLTRLSLSDVPRWVLQNNPELKELVVKEAMGPLPAHITMLSCEIASGVFEHVTHLSVSGLHLPDGYFPNVSVLDLRSGYALEAMVLWPHVHTLTIMHPVDELFFDQFVIKECFPVLQLIKAVQYQNYDKDIPSLQHPWAVVEPIIQGPYLKRLVSEN